MVDDATTDEHLVTIYLSAAALARSGLREADVLVLTGATTKAELIEDWERHQPTPRLTPSPGIFYTAGHIDRYAAMHRSMFGGKA